MRLACHSTRQFVRQRPNCPLSNAPGHIASLTAYLPGPEAGIIAGGEFGGDGGMTRKMIYAEKAA